MSTLTSTSKSQSSSQTSYKIATIVYNAYTSVIIGLLIPLAIVQDPVKVYHTVPGQVSIGVLIFAVLGWLTYNNYREKEMNRIGRITTPNPATT